MACRGRRRSYQGPPPAAGRVAWVRRLVRWLCIPDRVFGIPRWFHAALWVAAATMTLFGVEN